MNNETITTTFIYLQVYFEDPFYVAVCQRIEFGKLSVCKIVFGAEPKDYEVYDYVHKHWFELSFSPSIEVSPNINIKTNPKRIQRSVKKQVLQIGIGTKSQQALKLQQENKKLERHLKQCKKIEEEKERQFILKQQKKKEKHKGR